MKNTRRCNSEKGSAAVVSRVLPSGSGGGNKTVYGIRGAKQIRRLSTVFVELWLEIVEDIFCTFFSRKSFKEGKFLRTIEIKVVL